MCKQKSLLAWFSILPREVYIWKNHCREETTTFEFQAKSTGLKHEVDIGLANELRNQQGKNHNEEQHEMSLNSKMMVTL